MVPLYLVVLNNNVASAKLQAQKMKALGLFSR